MFRMRKAQVRKDVSAALLVLDCRGHL